MKRILLLFKTTIATISLVLSYGCAEKTTPSPANVTSSVISASTWKWSAPDYYINLDVPEITSANMDKAAIMVYCNTGGTSWRAVPFTQYTSSSNYFMSFNTKAGQVQVTWVYNSSLSSGDDPNEFYDTTVKFKVVVIPPNARISVDLTDYEAVRKEFGLKD